MNPEPCICRHLEASHDDDGCVICAANGQHCPAYWSQSDYDDSVQSALVHIVVTDRERHEHATQPERKP